MYRDIAATWEILKDVPVITGALNNYLNDVRKRWRVKQSTLPDDVALFLEYSFSPELQCFGKTGNFFLSSQRREKIRENTGLIPPRDSRLISESIHADLNASIELLSTIGKYKRLEFKPRIDAALKKEYYNKSGFVIGGPVPNDTSEDFLKLIKEATGLEFKFDLNNQHYPLITPVGRFMPVYNEKDETYDTDYGIIIRMPNPYMRKNTVILLMGCTGYATFASSKIFTEPQLLEENILSEINEDYRDESFYLIIEADIGLTGDIQQIRPISLNPLKELDEKWSERR